MEAREKESYEPKRKIVMICSVLNSKTSIYELFEMEDESLWKWLSLRQNQDRGSSVTYPTRGAASPAEDLHTLVVLMNFILICLYRNAGSISWMEG